ncbi:conserved membrane hypothetical protein [Candidatus Sulfotelmatomonas gaucii]|uniref:DUF418 domain-containing protein n=1 Tax=Candidatus Sulfuritelmatomonas gaucii TaxID=2043161 RepID=A0A2N9LPL0_9BACT|nr:conserved membrane hypothetical protein [Candidatus Sulfotelmatomonas gaucii]
MQPESQRVGPVNLSERILFIDVLRGLALFGILAANMRAFFAPLDCYDHIGVLFHSRADVLAQFFIEAFIQGKFISIFSFLFGMGFAIQMSRAEARGARFLSFYPRRLLALALFGLIHGLLIWAGDILLTYALSGAILLLFRKRQQKTLLWWAGSLFALPIVASTTFLTLYFSRFHRPWMDPKPPDMKQLYAVIHIYAHGTLRQILAQNWVEWKRELPTQGFAIYATALFLLGMWVWRAGIVQRLNDYKPVLKRVCAWCLPVGLIMSIYVAIVRAVIPSGTVSLWGWSAGILWLPGSHILAAGYASGLALIFLHQDWQRFVHPFAAVGRMALTNYLMQSVLCTLFFYHHTRSLYGRMGPALGLAPTVILYGAQVVFSNWWLQRYRFGPMEWLWRGMTYGKFPSMSKDESLPTIEPPSLSSSPTTLSTAEGEHATSSITTPDKITD